MQFKVDNLIAGRSIIIFTPWHGVRGPCRRVLLLLFMMMLLLLMMLVMLLGGGGGDPSISLSPPSLSLRIWWCSPVKTSQE